jgi:hypothetical protein
MKSASLQTQKERYTFRLTLFGTRGGYGHFYTHLAAVATATASA